MFRSVNHGYNWAMAEILQACQNIESPIAGMVREEMG